MPAELAEAVRLTVKHRIDPPHGEAGPRYLALPWFNLAGLATGVCQAWTSTGCPAKA